MRTFTELDLATASLSIEKRKQIAFDYWKAMRSLEGNGVLSHRCQRKQAADLVAQANSIQVGIVARCAYRLIMTCAECGTHFRRSSPERGYIDLQGGVPSRSCCTRTLRRKADGESALA